jgi:hypothetical protein
VWRFERSGVQHRTRLKVRAASEWAVEAALVTVHLWVGRLALDVPCVVYTVDELGARLRLPHSRRSSMERGEDLLLVELRDDADDRPGHPRILAADFVVAPPGKSSRPCSSASSDRALSPRTNR